MTKKFKFKLEGLRKIREFKEKQIKNELGELLKEIQQSKDVITKDQQDIEDCYTAQEAFLAEPSTGQMVQFFPQFIQTKRESQKIQNNILSSLNRAYENKIKELAAAKGQIKVLDNLKDKKKTEFSRLINKKRQEEQEEFTLIKRYRESNT